MGWEGDTTLGWLLADPEETAEDEAEVEFVEVEFS
jgi:hypothetical protein